MLALTGMQLTVLGGALIAIVAIGLFVLAAVFDSDGWFFVGFLLLVLGLGVMFSQLVAGWDMEHRETKCERRAEQYERETRWVRYGSYDADCLVQTEDGWVSIDRVIKAEVSE